MLPPKSHVVNVAWHMGVGCAPQAVVHTAVPHPRVVCTRAAGRRGVTGS